jgi:hypothetical protein
MVTYNKKYIGLVFLLLGVLVFQISVIPDTLNVKIAARLFNAGLLLYLFFMAIFILMRNKSVSFLFYFVTPSLLIILGYIINLSMSFSVDKIGQAGKLLPWLSVIVIPFLVKGHEEKVWSIFYKFVLLTSLISLVEYVAIFSGFLSPTVIETSRGTFFKGVISILHYLDGGLVYYRFYGVFQEPGTAAMFFIPAIIYSLVYSKYKSLIILFPCFFLTLSLGGIVGLFISISVFFLWKFSSNGKYSLLIKLFFFIVSVTLVTLASDQLSNEYESKQASASVREDNVLKFFNNFGQIVLNNPFGVSFDGASLSEASESDSEYVGSNFTFYVAFAQGGLISLIGYTIFFVMNCVFIFMEIPKRHCKDKVYACVVITLPSMLLFCFQRTTILETMLYAFLYSVVIMKIFDGRFSKRF